MGEKVTDLSAWRAAHARPTLDACKAIEACQAVTQHNLSLMMLPLFVWPRMLLLALARG